MLDRLDEETGWACCVCKDGYSYLPDTLLGFYVMVHQFEDATLTTSNLMVVHIDCHNQATEAARESHITEWASAATRNLERECNAILPIPGGEIPTPAYIASLTATIGPFAKGQPPINWIVQDIRRQLENVGAKGTVENILGLLPFFIYAGHALLDTEDGERGQHERRIERMLSGEESARDAIALSLWIISRAEWEAAKISIFGKVIASARIPKDANSDETWRQFRPILVSFFMAEKIQDLLKPISGPPLEGQVVHIAAHSREPWIEEFKTKIQNSSKEVSDEWKDLGEATATQLKAFEDTDSIFHSCPALTSALPAGTNPLDFLRTFIP
jgi:hypothetical protein